MTKHGGRSPAASTTTRPIRPAASSGTRIANTSAPSTVRTRQTPTQRRFSKLAAAINAKARSVGSPGRITAEDLAIVFQASWSDEVEDYLCTYCETGIHADGVSFDHVVPFARGGVNTTSNLVASCMTCQREKFTKSPEELAEWQQLVRYCVMCSKPFRPRWADFKRGLGHYCSRVCSGRAGGLTA